MSKKSKGVVVVDQSDSDLSLQLSDASSLSSDSDLSDSQQQQPVKQQKKMQKMKQNTKKSVASNKKKSTIAPNVTAAAAAAAKKKKSSSAKKKKSNSKDDNDDDTKYCTCRKGYDGKEFMIECDGCQEWFHGACVNVKANSIMDHYFCKLCLSAKKKPASTALGGKTLLPPPPKKKSIIILPISKQQPEQPPAAPVLPVISKLSIDQDDEDEDLDDICVLCDGDCTCGSVEDSLPAPPLPPAPAPKIDIPKVVIKKSIPAPTPSAVPKSKKSKKPKKSTKVIKHDISDSSSSSNGSESGSDDSGSSSESEEEEDLVVTAAAKNKIKKKPKKNMPAIGRGGGKSTTLLANIIRQKAPTTIAHALTSSKSKPKKGKKLALIKQEDSDEDDDEELIVDDLDDLLETMSPLSEHSSNESDDSILLESEEFFTDDDDLLNSDNDEEEEDEDKVDIDSSSVTMSPYPDSSDVHLDSGDDEDIENAETQAIIAEMTLDSDEEMISDSDNSGVFVEDDNEEEEEEEQLAALSYYINTNNHWSTDEDEEEEEFDYNKSGGEDEMDYDEEDDDEEEEGGINPLLPLLDSEGNLYDSIAAAFMQALAPIEQQQQDDTTTVTAAGTPSFTNEEYHLSAFELAHALSALSTTGQQQQQEFLRRPSLPSSAVSAAQRNRGSIDFTTSEAFRALSALVSDDLSLVHALDPIHENEAENNIADTIDNNNTPLHSPSILAATAPLDVTTTSTPPPPPPPPISPTTTDTTAIENSSTILPNQLALSLSTDLKIQEQILDILKGTTNDKLPIINNTTPASLTPTNKKASSSSITTIANLSRQILPKPSGSGIGSSSSSYFPPTLEQQIQDAINLTIEGNKKRGSLNTTDTYVKKRRLSAPASPAAIIDELEENLKNEEVSMDDLVDTSQLYTRSLSPNEEDEDKEDGEEEDGDNPYSRDLSRWQRIPIGAFRLMRSRNKLWLER